jgi:hypothetical protein
MKWPRNLRSGNQLAILLMVLLTLFLSLMLVDYILQPA